MENEPKIKGMNPVISVKDLSVIYDIGEPSETKSLDNVSLDILPREYVIIFGPSGCGKSTLLYSIAGLQRPTSGTVTVDQDDISKYKNKKLAWFHRYKIGMVFQSFHLVNTLSVSENICLPKIFSGLNFGKVKAGANELLRRYGILEQANKFPSELSGGQKQRVAVARALINNPEIILADEPVGNLDSKSAHVVMSIFEELNEIDKKTIILVTHDPAHLQYGNKIVYMMDGKITKVEWRKKKKEASVESYIFKEGKIREDLVRAEYIPLDLRQLMKSFKGMTQEQIGKMLVPFKAQQIFYHSFFSMTSDQILSAIKKTEDFLYLRENFEEFFNDLDMPSQQGGAGWDKRIAKKFSSEVKQLIDQANCISFVDKKKSAQDLANFIVARFELVVEEDEKADLAGVILDRLENRIGVEEFQKLIDISKKKKGLGFDRRTAIKIAREVELLLLLRYS